MNILVTKHVEIKKITLLLKSVANNAGLNVKIVFNRSRMILCSSGDDFSPMRLAVYHAVILQTTCMFSDSCIPHIH